MTSANITPIFRDGNITMAEALLNNPDIDLNKPCLGLMTPLALACEKGHLNIVKAMLANPRIHVDIEPQEDTETPLWLACAAGHTEIVEALLADARTGDAINRVMDNKTTPLYIACQEGKLEVVKALFTSSKLDKKQPCSFDEDNAFSPFHIACIKNHEHIIQYYLTQTLEQKTELLDETDIDTILKDIAPDMLIKITSSVEDKKDYIFKSPLGHTINLSNIAARAKSELYQRYTSDAFASTVLLCDLFLRLKDDNAIVSENMKNAKRVYKITEKLPMELQMLLWNRIYGQQPRNNIPTTQSEVSFRRVIAAVS
jgi:hypothetical protein